MKPSRQLLLLILVTFILPACLTAPAGSIFGRGGDDEDQEEQIGGMQVAPDMPEAPDANHMSGADMPEDMPGPTDMPAPVDMPSPPEDMKTCQDQCTAGTFDCQGPRLYTCENDPGTGCLGFVEVEQCGQDQFCDSNAGECACQVDEMCTPNERRCMGRDAVEVCTRSESGCTTWEIERTCDGRSYCDNNLQNCRCPASDCTSAGSTSCNGPSVVVCAQDPASGCIYPDTTQSTRCGDTEYCENGACQTCEEQCTPGTTVCVAPGEIRNCIKTSSDKCPRLSSPLSCGTTNQCLGRPSCSQDGDCATCGTRNGQTCYYCPQ